MTAASFSYLTSPHMPIPMSRERDHARSGCSPFSIDWAAAPYALMGNVRHRVFVIVDSPCTAATRRTSSCVGTLPLTPQRTVEKPPRVRITLHPAQKRIFTNLVFGCVIYQLLEASHALSIQTGQLARVEPGPHEQHPAAILALVPGWHFYWVHHHNFSHFI